MKNPLRCSSSVYLSGALKRALPPPPAKPSMGLMELPAQAKILHTLSGLHILGCTNVTIGKMAEMIGHRPPKNDTLRCFFKSNQTPAYVRAPDRFICKSKFDKK
ncbi:unnamed protein product [Dicrocoelium dendriticum]|nr:unnamed protein product [Dicrocoelium dendriticum]